jgi:hypothetical protein
MPVAGNTALPIARAMAMTCVSPVPAGTLNGWLTFNEIVCGMRIDFEDTGRAAAT